MWQSGTATDYFDLLKQLEEIATGRHMATAAISAGGTGYTVGDILSIAGGTKTHTATLEVTTVAAGVITGLRIQHGGAYTVDPTTTGNAVTGGTGINATVNLTMLGTGWTTVRKSQRAVSATIAAGGSGYTVNDKITVEGGLGIGVSGDVTPAIFNVDTEAAGVVTAVSVVTADRGSYEETAANPRTTTGGTGTGCTLNVTYADIHDDHSVLAMSGAATGSPDDPVVGLWTYEDTQGIFDVRNYALFGFTTWNDTVLFGAQAGISPGLKDTAGTRAPNKDNNKGCPNLPLKDNDGGGAFPLNFWFAINDRRIVGVVQISTALIDCFSSFYLGFTNGFGTTEEIPYPMFIGSSATKADTSALDNSTSPVTTSIVQCLNEDNWTQGPAYFLDPAAAWIRVSSGTLNASNTPGVDQTNYVMYPFEYGGTPLRPVASSTPDDILSSSVGALTFRDMTEGAIAVTPAWRLMPTPDSGDAQRLLIPSTIIVSEGSGLNDLRYPFGELDGVFWFSYADGGVSAGPGDFFDQGADRYRVFRTGHRTELDVDFFAILEA